VIEYNPPGFRAIWPFAWSNDGVLIGFAAIHQRTNTFSRVPGTLVQDRLRLWASGREILQTFAHTRSVAGSFLASAERLGITAVPLLAVYARASGPVPSSDLQALIDRLSAQICGYSRPLDGLFLRLSGTMLTDGGVSADAWLLQRLRETVGASLPIAVFLDQVANVDAELVSQATIVAGPQQWPPVDTPARVADLLERLVATVEGRIRPVTAVHRVPLLLPLAAQRTDREPLRAIAGHVRELESRAGVVAVTCFGGFPYADVPMAGAAVVVVADRSLTRAEEIAAEVSEHLWARRSALLEPGLNIEQAVHTAMATDQGLAVIAELGDAPEAGGPGEGTTALWALLDLGAQDAALAIVVDPAAVQDAVKAGVGSDVELSVGGKTDRRHGYPIDVRGRVLRISDGTYRRRGPLDSGLIESAGSSVVIEAHGRHHGRFALILTSEPVAANDPGLLQALGVPIEELRFLVLKSAVEYLAAWEPGAVSVLPAATPGITTPDLLFFPYERIPRPIWPLDPL